MLGVHQAHSAANCRQTCSSSIKTTSQIQRPSRRCCVCKARSSRSSSSSDGLCSSRSLYGTEPRWHTSSGLHTTHRSRIAATQGGLGDEEVDVAVFRFTLGIPGFDDSNIPRVIGAAVAALVAVNHALGANPAPPAQVRAEFLDITLAVLCFVAPEIEQRLRQVGPGRGRAGAGQVEGSSQLFALADGLPDVLKKELAWSSFALLKNVNCCSVLLLQPGGQAALLARGAFGSSCVSAGDSKASLRSISQSLSSSGSSGSSLLKPGQQQQWLSDRSALQQAGLSSCVCVPEGVQSALVQEVPGGALLLVLAERPRALSDKDRKWVAAIAAKLGDIMKQQ